jgi:hypothetical protein
MTRTTKIVYILLVSTVSVMFLVLASVFLDLVREAKTVYVVDVEKIYSGKQDKLKELVMNNAPENEIIEYRAKLITYSIQTEEYLSLLSEKNDITIFNKKAIFSNSKTVDLTQRVIDAVK